MCHCSCAVPQATLGPGFNQSEYAFVPLTPERVLGPLTPEAVPVTPEGDKAVKFLPSC